MYFETISQGRRIFKNVTPANNSYAAGNTVHMLITLVKLYKHYLAPYVPYQCKYSPSCSEYCIAAFQKKGVLKGTLLTIIRIIKCNPFSPGGYDPVR